MQTLEAYELQLELQKLQELRRSIELKLGELEYAEETLRSLGEGRRVYRAFSDLLIEITKDEAMEHVESMRLAYSREIQRLKEREKEIAQELSKLRAPRSSPASQVRAL